MILSTRHTCQRWRNLRRTVLLERRGTAELGERRTMCYYSGRAVALLWQLHRLAIRYSRAHRSAFPWEYFTVLDCTIL